MRNSPQQRTGKKGGGLGEDGKEEEEDDDDKVDMTRRVWIWVHPAAAKEALRELRRACALEGAPWKGSVQVRPWWYNAPLLLRRVRRLLRLGTRVGGNGSPFRSAQAWQFGAPDSSCVSMAVPACVHLGNLGLDMVRGSSSGLATRPPCLALP